MIHDRLNLTAEGFADQLLAAPRSWSGPGDYYGLQAGDYERERESLLLSLLSLLIFDVLCLCCLFVLLLYVYVYV